MPAPKRRKELVQELIEAIRSRVPTDWTGATVDNGWSAGNPVSCDLSASEKELEKSMWVLVNTTNARERGPRVTGRARGALIKVELPPDFEQDEIGRVVATLVAFAVLPATST